MEKMDANQLPAQPENVRWSKDNMMCAVAYEPLSEAEQSEVECILGVN